MLTGYQATTVAYYVSEVGMFCPDCAAEIYPNHNFEMIGLGLRSDPYGVESVCRYSLDERQAAHAFDDPDNYPEDNYDAWPRETCDECGKELDH